MATVLTKSILLQRATATGGFRGVRTEALQLPNKDNGDTAVFHAVVTLEDDRGTMEFHATADAGPHNMKPNMVKYKITIAETRAVVRAIKWALGEGGVAAEEMDNYEPEGEDATSAAPRNPRPAQNTSAPARARAAATGEMTEQQEAAIRKLCDKHGYELPDMAGWTAEQAAGCIKKLNDAVKAR